MIYKARELLWNKIHTSTTKQNSEGYWVPARSENYKFDSLWSRIKGAAMVLIGKYDAVDWEDE